MKLMFFVFILLLSCTSLQAQESFRIMFYNVENLFDTYDDPLKSDEDFLPGGNMKWNSWKYREKLKNITRVITAAGGMNSPAIVGLCEIENDSVLYHLTKQSPLRSQKYEYIITDSPDHRGLDIGLLYQRHQFKLISKKEYEIKFRNRKTGPSRNILHVTGRLINKDILDIFVCHFPSRSSGQLATENARIDAALLLREKIDSILKIRSNANIVIMGDFNDHPDNKSLAKVLSAKSIESTPKDDQLYNLFYFKKKKPEFGSYRYRGNWEILDQIIVNGHLLNNRSTSVKDKRGHIFKAPFLLDNDKQFGGKSPFRTNMGPRYIGGFSDHLPIYIDLLIN